MRYALLQVILVAIFMLSSVSHARSVSQSRIKKTCYGPLSYRSTADPSLFPCFKMPDTRGEQVFRQGCVKIEEVKDDPNNQFENDWHYHNPLSGIDYIVNGIKAPVPVNPILCGGVILDAPPANLVDERKKIQNH